MTNKPTNRSVLSNPGRCNICGQLIDMRDAGEMLVFQEFSVDDEIKEQYGVTDQDAADAVANALEAVAESCSGHELATVIRNNLQIRAHKSVWMKQRILNWRLKHKQKKIRR